MRRQRFHEAAHKVELGQAAQSNGDLPTATRPAKTRIYNEAAHKLGYRGPAATATAEREPEGVRRRLAALSDSDRDVVADSGRAALALGALGVVYGDIGTSPLYTEQVIFTSHRAAAHATPAG